MRLLKDYINEIDNVTLYSGEENPGDEVFWRPKFEKFLSLNNDNPNYEYLIGIKDYLFGPHNKTFIFIFKTQEQEDIKGYAALTLKKIVQDKKIKNVCFINEIIFDKKFCHELKQEWENIFIYLINNKDKIKELKDCDYFYTLSLNESIENSTSFNRFKKALLRSREDSYRIYNLFTKNYNIISILPQHGLAKAPFEMAKEIYDFIISQKLKKTKDINSIPNYPEIIEAIKEERVFYIKESNKISAICLCELTKLKKQFFHKLDNKFKLSSSLLPLFGRGSAPSEQIAEFDNLYIRLIEIDQEFLPIKRSQICTNIIKGLLTEPSFKHTLVFTIPSYSDMSIENAMKSFLNIETNLVEITFNDFEYEASRPLRKISKGTKRHAS